MPNTTSPDFFDLDFALSSEERQIRDTVARWVDDRVLPIIGECFENERFPSELIAEIAGMGLLGPTFEDYGCAGLNNVCYGLIMQELERGDSGIRSFASVQSGLCMFPIHRYGSAKQKEQWLPDMAQGRKIGCFGLTEPDGGSDPGAMKTRADRKGDEWTLNGAKMWITNGTVADLAIVWANTTDGIRGFIVEKGMPGYTARNIEHKFSLRASITSELFFDNVRVPEGNRLPEAAGLSAPLSCLTQARYGIAWGAVGAAMACYRETLAFAKERVLFGSPLSHKQLIQVRLADMARQIAAAQLICLQLGRLKDAGRMHHSQVSMAKWHCVRMGLDVARVARDLLGAGGISIECSPIRHALNLESVITYEGTESIHQLIVGREICGHAAF